MDCRRERLWIVASREKTPGAPWIAECQPGVTYDPDAAARALAMLHPSRIVGVFRISELYRANVTTDVAVERV